jgi:hypothetical protein
MSLDQNSFLENLTSLTLAIGERQDLRDLFDQLAQSPADQRAELIHIMSERIAAADRTLAAAFKSLADPRVFEATGLALQQCENPAE